MGLKKVSDCIKKNRDFLITTHTNPEGDALGSELALSHLLKKVRKNAVIINEDELPFGYDFLPGAKFIRKFRKNIKDIKFGCFVVLDCSGPGRAGQVFSLNKDNRPVINIDHHISNERFGDINWIEPRSSSCAEMIYRLYKELRVPLDKDAAMFLYIGILTDTGSFGYSNTTGLTHKIVSELLKFKLDVSQLYKNMFGNIPFQDMKLLLKILPTIRRKANGRIVWFQIGRNLLADKKISFDLSENVLNFARAIKDTEVAVLFKENLGVKNEVRVNFRSQGKVDVNKIASFFGGGGHKTASGCTINGRIDDVRKKVLKKIEEEFLKNCL